MNNPPRRLNVSTCSVWKKKCLFGWSQLIRCISATKSNDSKFADADSKYITISKSVPMTFPARFEDRLVDRNRYVLPFFD